MKIRFRERTCCKNEPVFFRPTFRLVRNRDNLKTWPDERRIRKIMLHLLCTHFLPWQTPEKHFVAKIFLSDKTIAERYRCGKKQTQNHHSLFTKWLHYHFYEFWLAHWSFNSDFWRLPHICISESITHLNSMTVFSVHQSSFSYSIVSSLSPKII